MNVKSRQKNNQNLNTIPRRREKKPGIDERIGLDIILYDNSPVLDGLLGDLIH